MHMEDYLKGLVLEAFKKQMGFGAIFSNYEWNEAKTQMLNDLYANKICLNRNITPEYFVNTMSSILVIMKRITNAG